MTFTETGRPPTVHTAGVGRSKAFLDVVARAEKLASIPRPVLIRGERGTGKELLARFIHSHSGRETKPYVVMNCAAYQKELFVAEMFGHEKGAFTGATQSRAGKMEQADDGTLFLDEVANLSRSTQEKLLRAIEYQKFERVGGSKTLEVDVRVVAATNAPLEVMMETGEFLPDLYDRLTFAELELPPLRRRREDITLLIDFFTEHLHQEIPNLEETTFTQPALKYLASYHWPGNIRQLKNVVERLYIMDEDNTVHSAELPLEITTIEPLGNSFKEKVTAFEKALLLTALKDNDANQRAAADQLGLTYDQFRHYYKKYDLSDLLV